MYNSNVLLNKKDKKKRCIGMRKKILALIMIIMVMGTPIRVKAYKMTPISLPRSSCNSVGAIAKNTCFKITNTINGGSARKILYCSEYKKDWATDQYYNCNNYTDSWKNIRMITYIYENGYSEYHDPNSNDIVKFSSGTDVNLYNRKENYDISQMAIWMIMDPDNTSSLRSVITSATDKNSKAYKVQTLYNNAKDAADTQQKDILTIKSEKRTEGKTEFSEKIIIKGKNLSSNTITLTLNSNKEKGIGKLPPNIYITNSSGNKINGLSCKNNTCSINLELAKSETTIYIKAPLDGMQENAEYNFSVAATGKTYLNYEGGKSPVDRCSYLCTSCNIQRVLIYNRNEVTLNKAVNIIWKKSKKCDQHCACGIKKNEHGVECCPEYRCPEYKCPPSGNNEKTITCNNGVSMLSECTTLSTKENSEKNIIFLKEEGTFSNALSSNEIFAGGTIKFNLIYHNTITWGCKSNNCENLNSIVGTDRVKTADELARDIINSQSEIDGKLITIDDINCYRKRSENNPKIETICIIEYTKKTSINDKGTISMSAKINNLDVLKNTEKDSQEQTKPWTGTWKVTINGNDNSCIVNIKQGKYNNLRYRPIDLKNPFPRNKVGINWMTWYNNNHNENHAFDYTEDNLGINNIDYKIEITPEIDKKIEEYNKQHSNKTKHDSKEFFNEFNGTKVGGSK